MARQTRIRQLREALQKALRQGPPAGDWRPLVQAEAALSQALPTLAREGAWNEGERRELALLRETHGHAQRRCRQALEALGEQLYSLGQRKEGWLAYAGMNTTEDAA